MLVEIRITEINLYVDGARRCTVAWCNAFYLIRGSQAPGVPRCVCLVSLHIDGSPILYSFTDALFLWWKKQDVTLEEVGQLIYSPSPHRHTSRTHSSLLSANQVFPKVESLESLQWVSKPFTRTRILWWFGAWVWTLSLVQYNWTKYLFRV